MRIGIQGWPCRTASNAVRRSTPTRTYVYRTTYLPKKSPPAAASSYPVICPRPFHEPYNERNSGRAPPLRIAAPPRARLFRSMNSFPPPPLPPPPPPSPSPPPPLTLVSVSTSVAEPEAPLRPLRRRRRCRCRFPTQMPPSVRQGEI